MDALWLVLFVGLMELIISLYSLIFRILHHLKLTQKPVVTSFIHKISKFQGRLSIKISSMGPRCAPTLILAVLQPPNSQSEKPILKSSWHLTACRYHAFFFVKQDRKGWGIPGIFGEFLRFSLLGIPVTQSLAFPSPWDRKVYDKTRWRHN